MEMEIGVILKIHLQILKILKIHASQALLMPQALIFHPDGINPLFK